LYCDTVKAISNLFWTLKYYWPTILRCLIFWHTFSSFWTLTQLLARFLSFLGQNSILWANFVILYQCLANFLLHSHVLSHFPVLSQGVNFIKILRANFLYECLFGSFSLVTSKLKRLPKRLSYEKFARKILMKFTQGYFSMLFKYFMSSAGDMIWANQKEKIKMICSCHETGLKPEFLIIYKLCLISIE